MIINFESTSKKEFFDFIKNYKNKLVIDITGICDPPLVTYNDFTLGDFPNSIVAKHFKDTNNKNFKINRNFIIEKKA